MAPASSKEFLDIQANYRVWIYSETRTLHDNNVQSQEITFLNLNILFSKLTKVKKQFLILAPLYEITYLIQVKKRIV